MPVQYEVLCVRCVCVYSVQSVQCVYSIQCVQCTVYKVYIVCTVYKVNSVCTVYRDWTTFTVQLYIRKIGPSKVHAYVEYKQQAMCTLSVQCCSAWPILPNPKPKMS